MSYFDKMAMYANLYGMDPSKIEERVSAHFDYQGAATGRSKSKKPNRSNRPKEESNLFIVIRKVREDVYLVPHSTERNRLEVCRSHSEIRDAIMSMYIMTGKNVEVEILCNILEAE